MSKQAVIINLIDQFASGGIGAEIGVGKCGGMSTRILQQCSIKHLYLIDPWQHGYAETKDSNDVNQEKMDKRYKHACDLANKYPGKATVIRECSFDAVKVVPDNLDFVFIDGNHAYKSVYQDIELWSAKIKPGGLVMGDDWSHHWLSVVGAVIDFCKNSNILMPPFTDYDKFQLNDRHVGAPAVDPVINKCSGVWWGLKK